MISIARCAAYLGALGVLVGASIAPAFADDIDPGADVASPTTGIAWDAETGEVIGGFTKEHNLTGPTISDGIAIQPVRTDNYIGVAVLLPGAAG